MPLPSIDKMVENRVSVLGFDETLREEFKIEAYYYLQDYTEKTDEQVEDESSYSSQQRILIADLTAFFCFRKAVKDISAQHTSTGSDGSVNVGKRLKKAKADVVESEFEYDKESKVALDKMYQECKRAVCEAAFRLGYRLALCYDDLTPNQNTVACPFIFVPSKC